MSERLETCRFKSKSSFAAIGQHSHSQKRVRSPDCETSGTVPGRLGGEPATVGSRRGNPALRPAREKRRKKSPLARSSHRAGCSKGSEDTTAFTCC
jgi:hypothetical protein